MTWALASLKKFHFNGLLVTKVYIVWATKVQSSYLSWHWRVLQILKKNWLVVWKKTWETWQIFTRALESVKIGTLMGSFRPKYKWYDMTLNFTKELCVMTRKNNAKFDKELTCHFKTDMRILTNFDSSTRKSKKLLFNWLVWPKYIMFELRKVQRSFVWWHWRLMQNLKEKWLVLSKMTWGIWQICIGWNKWIANLTKLFTHV